MAYDARLVKLIEDVLGVVTGKRIATRTAQRLAEEIVADGYIGATMSLHRNPAYNSEDMHAYMKGQGLVVDEPSQCSDAFRLGWVAAMDHMAIKICCAGISPHGEMTRLRPEASKLMDAAADEIERLRAIEAQAAHLLMGLHAKVLDSTAAQEELFRLLNPEHGLGGVVMRDLNQEFVEAGEAISELLDYKAVNQWWCTVTAEDRAEIKRRVGERIAAARRPFFDECGCQNNAPITEPRQMPDEIIAWPASVTPGGQIALTGSWSARRHYTDEAVRYVRAEKPE